MSLVDDRPLSPRNQPRWTLSVNETFGENGRHAEQVSGVIFKGARADSSRRDGFKSL